MAAMEPLRLQNAAEELRLARLTERARHVLARFRDPIEEREDLLSETLRVVLENNENMERREEYALGTLRHLGQQWVGAGRAHPTLSLGQDIVPGAKTPPRARKKSSSERQGKTTPVTGIDECR